MVLISSVLLMLLKVLLKTPLSHLTSAYYLGMLLSFFFFPSQSAFSSTLIRFYSERIYSCLNSPVYLMLVKQLADQLRVHYRQPACSKIIQVYLATEQRDARTHTGHLVQGRVPSPPGRAARCLGYPWALLLYLWWALAQPSLHSRFFSCTVRRKLTFMEDY